MALLGQYNPLKFYLDKRSRQWESDDDMESRNLDLVYYQTNLTPCFQLIFSAVTAISAKIYNSDDDEIATLTAPTIVDKTTYKQIIYAGQTLTSKVAGYYYILLTIDTVPYYSDMFAWKDDPEDWTDKSRSLLKVKVESANMTIGTKTRYIMPMSNMTYIFYLSAVAIGDKQKIEQVGNDQYSITNVLYGAGAFQMNFEISANRSIFRFLRGLGLLGGNGVITLTWNYETFIASDILVEDTTDHGGGMYQLKLSIVDESEIVSMSNDIV